MTARSIRATAAAVLAGAARHRHGRLFQPGRTGRQGAKDSAVVGIAYEPETLSPLLGYGKDGNSKLFDGLLAFDADMKLRPALATALPEVSADRLTYTYKLRQGVRFSDGKPFTAKDVVFTYTKILDPKTNNPSKGELDAVRSVEAKGDDTVVFTLGYPYAPFAERTVLPVVPEHVAARQDVNSGAFSSAPVGTGPYTLVKWSKGEKITFAANPSYWGGAPAVKKFTMAIIKDDDVRATRLRAGDLDGAILPPNLARTFKGTTRASKTYAAKTYDYRNVTLPTANKVAGDTAVRRALDLAVDRRAMVDRILEGAGKPAYGPVPTGSRWFAAGTERAHDLGKGESPPRRRGLEAGRRRHPREGRRPGRLPAVVPLRRQTPPGPRPRLRLRRQEGGHRHHHPVRHLGGHRAPHEAGRGPRGRRLARRPRLRPVQPPEVLARGRRLQQHGLVHQRDRRRGPGRRPQERRPVPSARARTTPSSASW